MRASLSGTLATMGPGTPYAIAARFAYPDRPVIAFVGDGAFQMNGMNEMITVKRYLDRLSGPAPFVFCVFNNQDLNQVTWEQRAMSGDPKYPGSQDIPDIPYAEYARLVGLQGIRCEDPKRIGAAWDEALSSDRPVVLEFKVNRRSRRSRRTSCWSRARRPPRPPCTTPSGWASRPGRTAEADAVRGAPAGAGAS